MQTLSCNCDDLIVLADEVQKVGGVAYLVGGACRDSFLGITEHKDIDAEIFYLTEKELGECVLRTVSKLTANTGRTFSISEVGKSFRVLKLRDEDTGKEIDISLPRRDKKVSEGHRGFEVTEDPTMSTLEAASRRDFTINAIMQNLHTGEIIDHFGGVQDITNRVIKMVSPNSFAEDPLRVLRAIQFRARFEFRIDKDTQLEMERVDLSELPSDRVLTEVRKLLGAEKPALGFESQIKIWKQLLPELTALCDITQDPEFHPEGSVWVHTLLALNKAADLLSGGYGAMLSETEKLTVLLAVLCHDLGKAETTELVQGRMRAIGHASAGVPLTEKLLDRLNVHTIDGFPVRKTVLALVLNHLNPPQIYREWKKTEHNHNFNYERAIRRLSLKVRLDLLAIVSLADMLGREITEETKQRDRDTITWFLNEAEKLKVTTQKPVAILTGQHLIDMSYKGGKQMGDILRQVYDLQLAGRVTTLEEAKEVAVEMYNGNYKQRLYTEEELRL